MLIDFFERMISYFLNCTRSVDVKLLFSINVELIYNNEFTEFIGNFMSLTGKNISSGFYCKEISGFNSVEQAMVFLASKLRLSKFPQYNQIKSILEGKHNTKSQASGTDSGLPCHPRMRCIKGAKKDSYLILSD